MQRTQCSFIKNVKECKERSILFIKNVKERENVAFLWKERKNVAVFWKERMPNPGIPIETLSFWSLIPYKLWYSIPIETLSFWSLIPYKLLYSIPIETLSFWSLIPYKLLNSIPIETLSLRITWNRFPLTLIRMACQPLPKEGLVVFKTPTSRGRGVGLDFSRQKRLTLRARWRSSFKGIDPLF